MSSLADDQTLSSNALAAASIQSGYIIVSFFTLLVYDHVTNLDKEVALVWAARWSTTKVLYLVNRILPVLGIIFQLLVTFKQGLSPPACNGASIVISVLSSIETVVVGAVLALRVYHLWAHRRAVQALLIAAFVATFVACVIPVIRHPKEAATQESTQASSCNTVNLGSAREAWKIFVPMLVLQTFLFSLTVLRVHFSASRRHVPERKHTPLMDRIVRDGTAFYIIALCCIVFLLVAGLSKNSRVTFPLLMSNFLTPALSVCVSHLILSIRSLAACLSSEPTFLLNNAELTRLQQLPGHRLREGATEGELFVDVEMNMMDVDEDIGQGSKGTHSENRLLSQAVMTSTRVGVFESA